MRLKRQTKTTALTIERNFSKPHPHTKPSTIAQFINPKFSALATFFPLATNAALSSEQRHHPT
ncbi:hypothetical protein [Vibrio aestuarianus]|uniref:hypothetical protein n=1 Tax=Vibrio aestuarianus TaxID=28171 RepID=UPI00237C72CA|nr:hypothetical protein [Vibrio aestuarianus]